MKIIESEISKFLDRKISQHKEITEYRAEIQLYYQGQMHPHYKQEENNLNKIVRDNVTIETDTNLKISTYYKNKKLSNLFIKNNVHRDKERHCVVYKYICEGVERCQPPQFYIGVTTTSLRQRATSHAQTGAIQLHHLNEHQNRIKTDEILNNTETLFYSTDKSELLIAEALFIKSNNPPLNRQHEGDTRILKIF